MSLVVPSVDELAAMSPAEVEAVLRELDGARRAAEVAVAELVGRVERAGVFRADGHRTPRAWGMAAANWSWAQAGRVVQVAHMLQVWPSAAGVGVAQLHALAGVVANPRVRPLLADAEELLVGWARTLDFDDFVSALMRWLATVDPDGSADAFERAHRERDAKVAAVGEQTFLDAHCANAQGAQIAEVFAAYCDSEFMADWQTAMVQHGEDTDTSKLARTPAQRRADALHAVFIAAAAARHSGEESTPTVGVVVDAETFEHHLAAAAAGGSPAPLDANGNHFCRTAAGVAVDPRDVIVAALAGHVRRIVVDSTGVIVNMGRRQRLFTGAVRDAILALQPWCMWTGCRARSRQVDHLLPWARGGLTDAANAGGVCGHHNRWRTRGYRTCRGPDGEWHHYRPDGTEIGWRDGHLTRLRPPATTT
jgi:hypothetical protein